MIAEYNRCDRRGRGRKQRSTSRLTYVEGGASLEGVIAGAVRLG